MQGLRASQRHIVALPATLLATLPGSSMPLSNRSDGTLLLSLHTENA